MKVDGKWGRREVPQTTVIHSYNYRKVGADARGDRGSLAHRVPQTGVDMGDQATTDKSGLRTVYAYKIPQVRRSRTIRCC